MSSDSISWGTPDSNLPADIPYTDQANTFTSPQIIYNSGTALDIQNGGLLSLGATGGGRNTLAAVPSIYFDFDGSQGPVRWRNSSNSLAIVVTLDGSGNITAASVAVGQSATAVAVATAGTIATANIGVSRVSPAAAVTGVILTAGTVAGQQVTVINEAVAANSVTFAGAGTSHVADGAGSAIAGLTARSFVWDSATALWYRTA